MTDTVEEVTEKIKAVERIPNEVEENKTKIKIMTKKCRQAKVNFKSHENPNIISFLEKIYNVRDGSKSCY